MGNVYFAIEIMGTIIVLLLLYATVFELRERTQKRTIFTWLLIENAIMLSTDAISWIQLNWVEHSSLLFVLVTITYVLPPFLQATFAMYLYEHISEKTCTRKFPFQLAFHVSVIASVIFFALCLLGKVFEIREGKYYPGAMEGLYYLFYIISCLYLSGLILFNGKKLGLHDFIAALSFCALPILAILLSIVNLGISLTVPFMSIEMLVIYIMLQSRRESVLINEGEIINIMAHFDDMTKLSNRRSYEERINSLEDDPRIMVVFSDVNGLKEVNDTLGHRAGDELLVRFSDILKKHYDEKNIYRISGDEFVIILENEEGKNEHDKYLALRKEIDANDGIASIGYSVGHGKDILNLLNEAETMMYEDKAWYYRKSGKSRRGMSEKRDSI